MAMRSITMTESQTATYDNGGAAAETLMRDLRERAEEVCGEGDMVEIYTADGVVADYIER